MYHINKVKLLVDQFACLEVLIKSKDVVMTLLESLSPSYEYLITTMETMPMKEFTIEHVTLLLMHEMTKRKEIDTQEDDVVMLTHHSKEGSPFTRKDTLHTIATRLRTKKRILPTILRRNLTFHLQSKMEHTLKLCVRGL